MGTFLRQRPSVATFLSVDELSRIVEQNGFRCGGSKVKKEDRGG